MPKKQAKKVPVAKQVWEWTELVSPEDIDEENILTAYRLRIGKCKSCRKNCPGNPICLCGLGESSWLNEHNYEKYMADEIEELNQNIRQDGEFVGLKNLGATCYVNTFLQLWFHNLNFRKAVYSFNEKLTDGETFPKSACGHLQMIFGLLQNSDRKNIDPSPFVKCLGLDTDLQQDAQEFSKLLLNLLNQNSEVGKVLCQEFRGEYEYHTNCKSCGTISRRPSEFYELDLSIQGNNDVEGCLKEFLQEESLDKDNQYLCGTCNCRRDATRQIVINSLPRTLNLQLLRFVFDKTTYTKRKLSRVIAFPDTLDLTSSVSSIGNVNSSNLQYDLTAVLIHRGPSAFSGHYIAHIKDAGTGLWRKFNDENVDKLKSGKKLNLEASTGEDFDIDMPKPSKVPKLKKNCHSSKNAYMLVYTRRNSQLEEGGLTESVALPDIVRQAVEKDNADFHITVDSMISDVRNEMEMKSGRRQNIKQNLKTMYEMGTTDLLANCQWVPTSWFKNALSNIDTKVNEILLQKFMCSHKKLDPLKVAGLKCISHEVACALSYGKTIDPRNEHMLCGDCVKEQCGILRRRSAMARDSEAVTTIVKEASDSGSGFYVGKYSLRRWKSIVTKQSDSNDTLKNDPDDLSKEGTASDDEGLEFNEDLLCEHGNFNLNPKHHCVIPSQAWHILQKYFPDAVAYPTDQEIAPCSSCETNLQEAELEAELKKNVVADQKSNLNDLLLDRNRPLYDDLIHPSFNHDGSPAFYVLSTSFVQQWRCFIRNPSRHDILSDINNACLICPHHKLMCDPVSSLNDVDATTEKDTVILWPSEWRYISRNFSVDVTVSISKSLSQKDELRVNVKNGVTASMHTAVLSEPDGDISCADSTSKNGINHDSVTANITSDAQSMVVLEYKPDICKECLAGRELEKDLSSRVFTDKAIYIRRVLPDDKAQWIKQNCFSKDDGNSRKRKRAVARGEKSVVASSSWTLKQLKIKIMQLYSIPPFDQNVWSGGQKLVDDHSTLQQLAIMPESTVVVIADEPDEKSLELLPVGPDKSQAMEEGFKGTSLIGR